MSGKTHWEGCHKEHHLCALAEINRLAGEVANRNQRALDGDKAAARYGEMYADIEALRAQLAEAQAKVIARDLGIAAFVKKTNELEDAIASQRAQLAARDAEVGRLRDFVLEFSEEPCAYGDDCSDEATRKHRHYRCVPCKARAALQGEG